MSNEQKIPTREERIKQEANRLLEDIDALNLRTVKQRVGYILNRYPEARDSDVTLALLYWRHFGNLPSEAVISQSDLYTLERMTTLVRARAKIQNEYRLFQPTEGVRRRRLHLSERVKEEQVADRPGPPVVQVFCDESGKNKQYLIVAGVWAVNSMRLFSFTGESMKKVKMGSANLEIHASSIRGEEDARLIEEFVQWAIENYGDVFGWKAVFVEHPRGRLEDNLLDLYVHYVIGGMRHEIQRGRVALPRQLKIEKDMEGGLDRLRIANMHERISLKLGNEFGEAVRIEDLYEENSRESAGLWLADAFAWAISRIMNEGEQTAVGRRSSVKDSLARRLVEMAGCTWDAEEKRWFCRGDLAVIFPPDQFDFGTW